MLPHSNLQARIQLGHRSNWNLHIHVRHPCSIQHPPEQKKYLFISLLITDKKTTPYLATIPSTETTTTFIIDVVVEFVFVFHL
jgi:hypothetical protein